MASFLVSKGDKMSQKNKNSSKRKRMFILAMLAISLYFLISFMSTIFGRGNKTVLPEVGILYDKSKGQGFIIKDETLYRADGSGQINLLVKEGERVGVGVEVANISILQDNSKLKQDLIQVDQQIAILSNKNLESNTDSSLDTMTTNIVNRIQEDVSSEEFIDIHNIKEELSALEKYSREDTLLSQSIDNLRSRREALLNQINTGSLRYYSKESGIISYDIDGYEQIFLPKEFENYSYDILQLKDFEETDNDNTIDIGDPIFKIIDNFQWYMAIKIEDKKDIEKYVIGQTMKLELEDRTELSGKIITINFSGPNAVIVLKFSDYLHNNYNLRHTSVDLIHSKQEGHKIPTDIIIERDDNKGVYIKEINGIVKFRPIKILGEEDEFTFIDKGNSNGYIELIEGEPVKTVTLFDEIFIDPTSVVEGEILK